MIKINHIEDADVATLRKINERLYDATILKDGDRRDLANLMRLILGRIEIAEVEVKEREDG
jgi:hypothetical protein